MSAVGGPLADQEILGLLRTLRGQDVAFMLVVTSDLRVGTFPEYRPTPELPTLPDFLRWLADQAVPTTTTTTTEETP